MISSITLHWCDVCRLMDGDSSAKFCAYCGLCDAWICEQDANRWDRRLFAAAKRKLESDYRGLQNYEELAKQEFQI